MGNFLYTVAVVLVIFWAVSFLGFHSSPLIHILLIVAFIAIALRVISGKNILNDFQKELGSHRHEN